MWLLDAGRGFGKTLSGSKFVHKRAMEAKRWIAIVAKTLADARDYMIEGPGGILRNCHPKEKPVHEVSKRRLVWPNGSLATIYSDEEPDQLRGFSGDTAWLDEFAKYRNPIEVFQNLQFGMRELSTDRPRTLITTTPRPLKILSDIAKDPGTVVVNGSSYENRANLDANFFSGLTKYEGTRIGRQEIHGEILEQVQGALWSRQLLDELRVKQAPSLRRCVVAIDPSVSNSEDADEAGIIVAGVGHDGHGYVLEDASGRMSSNAWAAKAVALYEKWGCTKIVAESNNGGDMIEATLRQINPNLPIELVHAKHGKVLRAEPVAVGLYDRKIVHHVGGGFQELEDQMVGFTVEFDKQSAGYSPDRVDALVYALTELMVREMPSHGCFERMRRVAEAINGGPIDMGPLPSQMRDNLPRQMKPPSVQGELGWGFTDPNKANKGPPMVRLKMPKGMTGGTFVGASGKRYHGRDGVVEVTEDDAIAFLQGGFQRL